jgi:hypothetical protein
MTEDKKLFARFDWDDYRNDGDCSKTAEVKDIADAAKKGAGLRADFFTTYTQGTVTVGGKIFTGDAEPQAGRHYLQQQKIYTPADVLAELKAGEAEAAAATVKLMADLKRHGMGHLAAEFAAASPSEHPQATEAKAASPDTRFAKLPYKGFVKLEDGETAWDAKGNQLWPVAAPATAPKIKPNNEFDL